MHTPGSPSPAVRETACSPSPAVRERGLGGEGILLQTGRGVPKECAFWYACAARRTSASAYLAPTIWSPMGRCDDVKPHGTEIAGCCVRLKG